MNRASRLFIILVCVLSMLSVSLSLPRNAVAVISWDAERRLTYDSASSWRPNAAATGDYVHVVWMDRRDGLGPGGLAKEIYYKRSSDKGLTWGSDQRLTDAPYGSDDPRIALQGGIIHLIWDDDRHGYPWQHREEIYYRRSTDNGDTWDSEQRLTNRNSRSSWSDIDAVGNYVYVIYEDGHDIRFIRSTDGGSSWVGDSVFGTGDYPVVTGSGTSVHALWYYDNEIYYKRSQNNGEDWGSNQLLFEGRFPEAVAVGATIHLVYELVSGDYSDLYYRQSPDNGVNWNSPFMIAEDVDSPADRLSISVNSNNVVVTWSQRITPDNPEIYLRRSYDGGTSTSWNPVERVSNDPASSRRHSVACLDSLVHVLWQDGRDGNDEIYYRRGEIENMPPVADFEWEPDPADEGEGIGFTDLSTDLDGTIVTWEWTFDPIGSFSGQYPPDQVWGDNGVYDVTLEVTDDDGATDQVSKLVAVLNKDPVIEYIDSTLYNNTQRTQGYWTQQCKWGPGDPPPSEQHVGIKQEYIDFIAENSEVWAGIQTKDPICEDLEYNGNTPVNKLRRQLIAVWLNVASKKLFIDSPLDHPGTTATSIREFIEMAEWAILNLPPGDEQHLALEEVAAAINEDNDPNNPNCCYIYTNPVVGEFEAKVTDPGSDDLTLEWDFDGNVIFVAQETVVYFNDPNQVPDPYPSPGGTFPFTIIDTQIWGYSTPPRILNPRLRVTDDDGGMAQDEDPGQPWSADWTFEYEISWIYIGLGFTVVDVTVTYLDWDSVVIRFDPLTGLPMSDEGGGFGLGESEGGKEKSKGP
jgi:hypothetical protein